MTIRESSSDRDGRESPAALRLESSSGPTAWLTVEAEAGPSRSFPIASSVVRVGSHLTCAVRLDESEPHALTVERRPNGYRVHNRTDRSLSLAGEPLVPRAARDWPLGAALQLAPAVTLRLAPEPSHSDPLPGRRPAALPENGVGGPERGPARRIDPGPRRFSWAAVVPLVLLAVAVKFSGESSPAREPVQAKVETDGLSRLILDLHGQGFEGRYVAGELQRARQDFDLGKVQPARERLFRLRDWILTHRSGAGRSASRPQVFDSVLDWIAARV
jgi:hypothetical protein